jgi:hypothetical protein
MQITYTSDYRIAVVNELGEMLKAFNQCDEDRAYAYFLSCLTPAEREAEDQRIAKMEADIAMDAEDAANRRLSSDHYSGW